MIEEEEFYTNAKRELLEHLQDKAKIKCAQIEWGNKVFDLKINYSQEDLRKFLDSLDFKYFDGHGSQELYGLVWFEDGTWLERGEYDGSEWWEYKFYPEVPKELK